MYGTIAQVRKSQIGTTKNFTGVFPLGLSSALIQLVVESLQPDSRTLSVFLPEIVSDFVHQDVNVWTLPDPKNVLSLVVVAETADEEDEAQEVEAAQPETNPFDTVEGRLPDARQLLQLL